MNLALFAWVASGYRYKAVAHKRRAPKKVKQALPPRVGRAGSGGPAGAPQWARPQPMRIPSGPVRPCCRPCLACAFPRPEVQGLVFHVMPLQSMPNSECRALRAL